ncbi:MAG: hypothetical protein GX221_03605 [Candidatus Riflebacteria bacterium]|nr:hypothetical protein [Candidatus Riflebacteria bacterium]
MLFIKRTLPLFVTFVVGTLMIIAFFSGASPDSPIKRIESTLPRWTQIVMAFTMVLGSLNLVLINLRKVNRKVPGYGYSIVLLVGFFAMAIAGLFAGSWRIAEKNIKVGGVYRCLDQSGRSFSKVMVIGIDYLDLEAEKAALLKAGDPASLETAAGLDMNAKVVDRIRVAYLDKDDKVLKRTVKDEKGREKEVDYIEAVTSDRIKGICGVLMHDSQRILYKGVFANAQATMFSLLAFFVASASFRAFRIKSKESALLMLSAFIVMLGNIPLANTVSMWLMKIPVIGKFLDIVTIKEWLLAYPSSAAQTAIIIGATLGSMTASLKILLGIERSHLGGEG